MQESVRLTPHTSDAQDVLATWHALKALPSQVHAVSEYLQQQLMHLQTDRQQGMLSSADAKADLMGCLEAVTGNEQGNQATVHAVRHCMRAAAEKLQVSLDLHPHHCSADCALSRLPPGSLVCNLVFTPRYFLALAHWFSQTLVRIELRNEM